MAKKKQQSPPPTQENRTNPESSVRSAPQIGLVSFDPRKLPHVANNTLPLIWVDGARMFFRPDKTGSIRFYAMIEDSMVEVARLHAQHDFWKGLVDSLAATMNHYPTKESVEAEPLKGEVVSGDPK